MTSLIVVHWGWLFGALILGVVVGAMTWQKIRFSWTDRWVHIVLGVVGIAIIVALLKLVHGRPGYWLDLALWMLVPYTVGCLVGWGLREVAETPHASDAMQALAAVRPPAGKSYDSYTGPLHTSYVSKPGATPLYRPGSGIVDARLAHTPEWDAATTAKAPATAAGATSGARLYGGPSSDWLYDGGDRPPYLSKPGSTPYFRPGSGIVDPRPALAAGVAAAAGGVGVGNGRSAVSTASTPSAVGGPTKSTPTAAMVGSGPDRLVTKGPSTLAPANPPEVQPGAMATNALSSSAPAPGALASAKPAGSASSSAPGVAPSSTGASGGGAGSQPGAGASTPVSGTGASSAAPSPIGASGGGAGSQPRARASTSASGAGASVSGSAPTTPAAVPAPTTASGGAGPAGSGSAPTVGSSAAPEGGVGANLATGAGTGPAASATVSPAGPTSATTTGTTPAGTAAGSGGTAGTISKASPTSVGSASGSAGSAAATASSAPAPSSPPGAPSSVPSAAGVPTAGVAGSSVTKAPDPPPAAPVPDEHKHAGNRPQGFADARGGNADDLKRIKGIGPQNEGRLHGLGIWHFDQIAAWTPDNVKWVGSYLAFHGRIDRERWIEQAKALAAGEETEFSRRFEAGRIAGKHDDGSHGQSNIDFAPPHTKS